MPSVAVVMGGSPEEHEPSLATGRACSEALCAIGYDVREVVYACNDFPSLMRSLSPSPDVVFNALHGSFGEDGCIQGLLELLHIPYTHSGVLASALAMDKPTAKRMLVACGIRTPQWRVVPAGRLALGEPLARPFVIKPPNRGSSHNVHVIDGKEPLPKAVLQARTSFLVERYIPGKELSVTVLEDEDGTPKALGVTEIIPPARFYDYRAKYALHGGARHVLPAVLPEEIRQLSMRWAIEAHDALGCRGISRSDFRYRERSGSAEELFYLETNSQPGMTPTSLAPEQACRRGLSLPQLCRRLVERAICDR